MGFFTPFLSASELGRFKKPDKKQDGCLTSYPAQ